MSRFLLCALLLVMPLLGCGSDPSNGSENLPECTEDWQCSSNKCENGICSLFVGEDSTTQPPEDGVAKDLGDDPDTTPLLDTVTPPEDTVTPPQDTTQPPDTTVKPPLGKVGDIGVYPTTYLFTYVPYVVNPQGTLIDIYNEGGAPLTLGSIKFQAGSSSEFTITALPPMPKIIDPYDHVSVMVAFKEKAPHGKGYLLIGSDDPDEPVVTGTLDSQSKVAAQPCIQINPSTLSFGAVERGQSKTLPFKLINCSDSIPLQINKIERSAGFFGMALSDEFQITPSQPLTPFILAPNQTADLNVTYAPGLAGFDSGHFMFKNNDPTSPEAKLAVSGTGTPPPLEKIGLHFELEWDTNNTDVDMHILSQGGEFGSCATDCFYGNMHPDWGIAGNYLDDPFLDYDDVDGYGPEHTNIEEPIAGSYKVIMHYYADNSEGASKPTVRVYSYGQLIKTFGPTSLSSTNMTWDVCSVDWPSAAVTTLGNVYSGSSPGACFNF